MANETEVKYVSKLSMANAGVSPKKVHALDGEQAVLPLCRIFAMCDGIKQVDDKVNGKIYYALRGKFQSVSMDAERTVTRSGVLYLPAGIHDNYLAAAKQLDEGSLLNFAIEVRAKKANNPAGYTYEAVELLRPAETDPLDTLAAQVEKRRLTDGAQSAASEPVAAKHEEKKPATKGR